MKGQVLASRSSLEQLDPKGEIADAFQQSTSCTYLNS